MKRKDYRKLKGEQVIGLTIKMRAGIHDKLEALVPPGSSIVQTVETMTEIFFERQLAQRRKISNTIEK